MPTFTLVSIDRYWTDSKLYASLKFSRWLNLFFFLERVGDGLHARSLPRTFGRPIVFRDRLEYAYRRGMSVVTDRLKYAYRCGLFVVTVLAWKVSQIYRQVLCGIKNKCLAKRPTFGNSLSGAQLNLHGLPLRYSNALSRGSHWELLSDSAVISG